MELNKQLTNLKQSNLDLANSVFNVLTESEMLSYLEDTLNTIKYDEIAVPSPQHDIAIKTSCVEPIKDDLADIYNFLLDSNTDVPNVTIDPENYNEVLDFIQEICDVEEVNGDEQSPSDYAFDADFNQDSDPMNLLNSTDDLVLSPFQHDNNQEPESLEKFIAQNDVTNADLNFDWTQFVNFPFEEDEAIPDEDEKRADENNNEQMKIVTPKKEPDECYNKNSENLQSEIEKNFKVSKHYNEVDKCLNQMDVQPNFCHKLIIDAKKNSSDSKTSVGKYSIYLMPLQKDDNDDGDKFESYMQLKQFVQKIGKNSKALKSIVKGITQSSSKRFIIPFTPKQMKLKKRSSVTLQERLAKIDKEIIKISMINYDKQMSVSHLRKQLFNEAGQLRDSNTVVKENQNVLSKNVKVVIKKMEIESHGLIDRAAVADDEKIVVIIGSGEKPKTPSKKRASLPYKADVKTPAAKKPRLSLGNLSDISVQRTSIRLKEKLRNQN